MNHVNHESRQPRSLFRCPRCGKGKLYQGVLTVADTCSVCGLKLSQHEQGDGPAFFGILIIGTLAGIGAAVTAVQYDWPLWIHAVIWGPFVVVGSILSLRWLKAALVTIHYRLKAEDFKDAD